MSVNCDKSWGIRDRFFELTKGVRDKSSTLNISVQYDKKFVSGALKYRGSNRQKTSLNSKSGITE